MVLSMQANCEIKEELTKEEMGSVEERQRTDSQCNFETQGGEVLESKPNHNLTLADEEIKNEIKQAVEPLAAKQNEAVEDAAPSLVTALNSKCRWVS